MVRAWALRLCDVRRLLVVESPTPARTRRPGFFRAAAVAKASSEAPVILKMPPPQTKPA